MDCCNYVQPYTGTGHFYQQHNFYYENTNAYAAYGAAPVSNTIEANVRYNRLPPAYPTDYVYNPKEARLRKAMREQSRELSRQSILQTAIASNAGTATATGIGGNGNNGIVGVSTPTNFLNNSLTCTSPTVAAAVFSLPGSSSINSNRIINPWFPVDHAAPTSHLKPILSPRVMAVHQRTLDKTKEAKRKQVECGALGAFSAGSATAGYTGDFATGIAGAGSCAGQGSNEYCVIAEFGDGQKWHPYQNGANAYHARGAAMSKIGALHPNVQNTNLHGHGPWTQFCGLPLPTSAAKNTVIRGPRHMVFLQEQQNQHCNFSDEMQLPYIPSKVEVNHRLHVAYPQADHQSKNAVSPSLHMSHHQDNDKCMENGPRWESGVSAAEPVISNLVAGRESALLQEQNQDRKLEQESCRSLDRDESLKQKMNCKQPLPGFHQAFGSTEIGRFSRSEFFANMVGENNNVSNSISDHSCCNGNGSGELSNDGNRLETTENTSQGNTGNVNVNNANSFSNLTLSAYYNEVRAPGHVAPRWHSPYVSVIGSEI